MSDKHLTVSRDHEDEDNNSSGNPSFESVLEMRLSRRDLFRGTAGLAALSLLGGFGANKALALDKGHHHGHARHRLKLDFEAVAKNRDDLVTLPPGYRYSVLYAVGDPIAPGVTAYANDGTDSAASFSDRAGDHHDGMSYFGLGKNGRHHPESSDRALLVMNHEAITPAYLHPAGPSITDGARTSADEVLREFYAHGVSVIEIARKDGHRGNSWHYKQDSRFNRRIHTLTEMKLSGPAAKTPYMITKYSPDGSKTRGTVNNCANGETPWGTYLTCEENWAGYFRRIEALDNPNRTVKEITSFNRYGVRGNGRELWATPAPDTADNLYGRWNAMKLGVSTDGSDDYRHVANTYGWVVEIDPFDVHATPVKRTALGRFAHEGAWLGPVKPGRPLVWYMGCDSRNEYIYKYVSNEPWDPSDADRGLKAGNKYLDNGKLYVARFNADGTGEWKQLAFGTNGIDGTNAAYPFADQADVLVNARLAADKAGATKMDRPEWGAVNPRNGEVYFTLTNTSASSRPINKVDAANPRFYNDIKTTGQNQKGNPNGHIIRMAEHGGDVGATNFIWDIYLFGARATANPASINVSGLTDVNDFSSPDGAWFSHANPGLMWIQTDDGAYTDVTNCMMLAAVPGKIRDGFATTIVNEDGAAIQTMETYVGKEASEETLRRFLVGPKECEITGIAESPDGRTLFVNIQHPGEDTTPDFATGAFGSHWPGGGLSRPRSATIVITREDNGLIGL